MKTIIRYLLILIVSLILTLFASIATAFVAFEIYNWKHPISDPVARGDDLGGPMFSSFFGFIVFAAIFPVALFIINIYSNKISKKENDGSNNS
jgi:heme/copper-type cytochrome/quinol oxidase subunit 3